MLYALSVYCTHHDIGLSVNFLPQDLYNKVNLDRIVDLILDVSEPKFRHSVIALKPQSISST